MADGHEELTEQIIGAAIAVHKEIGPGALESAYEACLAFELEGRRLAIRRQVLLPLIYKGRRLQCGYRLDIVVEDRVVIEIKAVARIERVHMAQLISYLKLSGCSLGLLLNFHVPWLANGGIRRVVHNHPES